MIDLSREAIEDMAQGIADNLGGIVHDGRDVSDTLRAQAARVAALEAQLAEAVEWADKLAETLMVVNAQQGGRNAARLLKDYRDHCAVLAKIKGDAQ